MSYVTAVRNFSPGNVKIITDYTFRPDQKRVTIPEEFKPEQILLIANATRGAILWDALNSGLGGRVFDGNIELDFDTTGHDAGDRIIIYVAINENNIELINIHQALHSLNEKFDVILEFIKGIQS